jgi:myo-inositol-1(or 4)-monophosphatase
MQCGKEENRVSRELLDFAVATARDAGALLNERFRKREGLNERLKGPRNVVTQADLDAETLIRGRIEAAFPGHAIVGEEGVDRPGSEIRWFVDPLDGTTNFAFGIPHWSVSIGACDEEGELIGVVYDPVRDEVFSAVRGAGAYANGSRLQVAGKSAFSEALVATGFAAMRGDHPDLGCLDLFGRVLERVQGVRRLGSAALDLSYVAAGRFDLFFEDGLSPWDTTAGALIVKEAGGDVREYDGSARYRETGRIIAGGRELVARFLEEMSPSSGR